MADLFTKSFPNANLSGAIVSHPITETRSNEHAGQEQFDRKGIPESVWEQVAVSLRGIGLGRTACGFSPANP
jgi:hypothetical protein